MPGGEIWKQVMLNLPAPFPELAERNLYIPSSWDEFDNITKYHVLEKGSIYSDFYYIQSTFKCNVLLLLNIREPTLGCTEAWFRRTMTWQKMQEQLGTDLRRGLPLTILSWEAGILAIRSGL